MKLTRDHVSRTIGLAFRTACGTALPWLLASPALANQLPACIANGSSLPINNHQVEIWQDTTANAYKARAHIKGPLLTIYPDASGHHHLAVQIGATAEDAVEVIYNIEFGDLPELQLGDEVEACGDYITANAPHGPYPRSPNNAIVHWVHHSNSPHHESGYVAIAGVLYGWP